MSRDRLSSAPPFTIGDVTFRCWITDDGQRFEWRSECGHYVAGRSGALYWARGNGRDAGHQHKSLRSAMEAAIASGRATTSYR